MAEVVVTARRCGFFCKVGRFFTSPHGIALAIIVAGGGPEDPVTDALAGVEEAAAAGELGLTRTVAGQALKRPFVNSPSMVKWIQSAGRGVPDPGGLPGALRYEVPGSLNGSTGTYELVINPQTNTVYHFLFRSH